MTSQKTLFKNVTEAYTNLLAELDTAQSDISMMYYAFDSGIWSAQISRVLAAKARSGIRVRLMADGFGQVLDNVGNSLANRALIRDLRATGVEVVLFNPVGNHLTKFNRLHCKICAIDQRTVFLGGSNIGDHYPTWDDSNLRLDGNLGNIFHDLYDYVRSFSRGYQAAPVPQLDISQCFAGDARIWLTLPKQRQDIRQALLRLIRDADQAIHLRTWYFLPDPEILDALMLKAEQGVKVNILFSHKTRVRPIDFANYIPAHKLAKAGACIFRYTPKYMHAKVTWNNHGDILFGSANLEGMALRNTFECCVLLRDQELAASLHKAFENDTQSSLHQTTEIFRRQPTPKKALSYACNLAAPWL